MRDVDRTNDTFHVVPVDAFNARSFNHRKEKVWVGEDSVTAEDLVYLEVGSTPHQDREATTLFIDNSPFDSLVTANEEWGSEGIHQDGLLKQEDIGLF